MTTKFNNRWAKLIKLFIYTVLATVACVFCAIKTDTPLLVKVAGWFGMLFFGLGGMYAIVRDFRSNLKGNRPVQILDEGLFIGEILIRWGNIIGLSRFNGGVLVFTNNAEERLAEANLFRRLNIMLSLRLYKTDIIIPELGFEGSCNDFIAQCQEEIRKFESKNNRYGTK